MGKRKQPRWQLHVEYWARSEVEPSEFPRMPSFAVGNMTGYFAAVEDANYRRVRWPWSGDRCVYARRAIGAAGVERFIAALGEMLARRVPWFREGSPTATEGV